MTIKTPYELMEKLISFPTVSRDPNTDLIDWVESYLAAHGIVSHRHWRDEARTHCALFAHVGPEIEGGVVLSGHTDVVPVDGQPWSSDPFTVTERDGKYFGRGTCDMKGFDALAIWALVEAKRRGVTRPLQIALSYDEEVGCTGAPAMIEAMQGVLPKAELAIIGEPSLMKCVNGHKGGVGVATHVVGFEVHSSIMHRGVSAVMEAAKLLEWANEVNAQNMVATPDALAAMFDPPWTNAHVGTIEGGTANNITAKDCKFIMGFRVVPSENKQDWVERYTARAREVEAEMQAIHPEARIDLTGFFDVPGLKPEEHGVAENFVRRLTGDNASHVVSYGTEAGQFQEAGYSAVICGPGSIEQAHQPDEYITIAEFEAGQRFMERLLEELAA